MSRSADQTMNGIQSIGRPQIRKTAGTAKERSNRQFLRLLFSLLRIGFTGFGGGSAMIPVIEEDVVDRQHLVSKHDYDEDVISACLTPGALPVEIAAGLGRRSYGMKGMIACASMMALPGALMTVLIQSLLSGTGAGALRSIQYLSIGISAFIASLLIAYAMKTQEASAKEGKKTSRISLAVMAAVFVLTCGNNLYGIFHIDGNPIFGLSTISVLALAFFVIFYTQCRFTKKKVPIAAGISFLYLLIQSSVESGFLQTIRYPVYAAMVVLAAVGIKRSVQEDLKKSRKNASVRVNWTEPVKEALSWILFLMILALPAVLFVRGSLGYILKGILSSLMSFGGGDAYLSVADGLFVNSSVISSTDFYSTLVPIANVLPGSILCKILSGIGYAFGAEAGGNAFSGYLTALAGFGVSVAASGMIFGLIAWLFRSFDNISVFQTLSRWIRPIISGLLLNVMLTMIRANISTGALLNENNAAVLIVTIGLIAANLFLQFRRKTDSVRRITLSAAIGAVCMAVFAI